MLGDETEAESVRSITLTADEEAIRAAEARAEREQTTLDEAFREWLDRYGKAEERLARLDQTMSLLKGKFHAGRKITRDEMTAR